MKTKKGAMSIEALIAGLIAIAVLMLVASGLGGAVYKGLSTFVTVTLFGEEVCQGKTSIGYQEEISMEIANEQFEKAIDLFDKFKICYPQDVTKELEKQIKDIKEKIRKEAECAQIFSQGEDFLQNAEKFQSANDYVWALSRYKQIIDINPGFCLPEKTSAVSKMNYIKIDATRRVPGFLLTDQVCDFTKNELIKYTDGKGTEENLKNAYYAGKNIIETYCPEIWQDLKVCYDYAVKDEVSKSNACFFVKEKIRISQNKDLECQEKHKKAEDYFNLKQYIAAYPVYNMITYEYTYSCFAQQKNAIAKKLSIGTLVIPLDRSLCKNAEKIIKDYAVKPNTELLKNAYYSLKGLAEKECPIWWNEIKDCYDFKEFGDTTKEYKCNQFLKGLKEGFITEKLDQKNEIKKTIESGNLAAVPAMKDIFIKKYPEEADTIDNFIVEVVSDHIKFIVNNPIHLVFQKDFQKYFPDLKISAEAYLALGDYYVEEGNSEAGKGYYQKVFELYKNSDYAKEAEIKIRLLGLEHAPIEVMYPVAYDKTKELQSDSTFKTTIIGKKVGESLYAYMLWHKTNEKEFIKATKVDESIWTPRIEIYVFDCNKGWQELNCDKTSWDRVYDSIYWKEAKTSLSETLKLCE